MTYRILIIWTMLILVGCPNKNQVKADYSKPLDNNEGYLGFVIDSLDALTNIEIYHVEDNANFYIGGAKKGVTLKLLKLKEGEYCLHGFDVYNFRVDFKNHGFCTLIESGELNYFNEFIVRDPVTTMISNFNRFKRILQKEYPKICNEYLGVECNL